MEISAWDSAFVRARRRDVHPLLADPAGYGSWWPGARSAVRGAAVALTLRPPTLRGRLGLRDQRLRAVTRKVRPDLGIDLDYTGSLSGTAEWYYLDEPAGVVVSYVLRARVADRGWRAVLGDHRAAVRAALDELKDRLEGARVPGAEPDPRLLVDQRAATAAFRAGVEAWERKLADRSGG